MPPMENTPGRVTHISPSSDPGLPRRNNALDTTASAAEQVSPPLPIISEHAVILGTVAATAVSPTFEGELDGDADAIERAGWIETLWRRVAPARNGRPPRRHYPQRLDGEFIADARMDREMYRL